MPFGFVNAPSIFQRAISETLDPLLYLCCLVYLDDVIIYSNSLNQHQKDLEDVFNLLSKYNWKIKLNKCQFISTKINYLGHEISNGKVSPLDRNLEKLLNMKKPSNADEMTSFLGFCGYYKKFIQGYDYLVHPLRKFTIRNKNDHKNFNFKNNSKENNPSNYSNVNILGINPNKFNIDENQQAKESYEILLKLLSSKPILKIFDPEKEIIVKTDVSSFAWGAALIQQEDGIEYPVSFASGTLNSSQRNWPTWKREAFGVLKAVQKWSHYLLGVDLTLVTDHAANVFLLNPEKKHPPIINNWIVLLSQYRYKIIHRPGKSLVMEDSLSGSPNLMMLQNQNQDETINLIEMKTIVEEQKKDEVCQEIFSIT